MDNWFKDTKVIIQEAKAKAENKSVDELVRLLNKYSKLEEGVLELLLEIQNCNTALRRIVVEKKSISVTG